MKLHLNPNDARYSFSGYGAGYVAVNARRYAHSIIVTPERVVEDWGVSSWDGLSEAHFTLLAALKPSLVLLGSGSKLRFPSPQLARALHQAQIGLEVMDTPAACRTYNILVGEGRTVAAAVIVE